MVNMIRNILKNNRIDIYQVEFSKRYIEDGVRFESLDLFIDMLQKQNIDVVFYDIYFDDINDYLITQELVEKELGVYEANNLFEILGNDFDKHNNKILKIDFSDPSAIVVGAFVNSNFFYVFIENEQLAKSVVDPIDKLDEILVDNEEKIIKIKEEKCKLIENLKQELSTIVKNDERFLICTNQHLRSEYIKNLLQNQLNHKFGPLKELWLADTTSGIYRGAIDFIELLWKEIKK